MKKAFVRIISVAVIVFTLLSVVSCSQTVPFSRGTIDQNTYKSEFAGITFTKPSEWVFYSEDQISQLLGSASAQLGSDEFDKATEGSIVDFMATSSEGNSVNLEIKKGGAFLNLNASVQESIKLIKESYESLNFTCTASDPVDKKLGNDTYKMVTIQVSAGAVNMTQYAYFRKVGSYFYAITCTATYNITQSQFEAMFS